MTEPQTQPPESAAARRRDFMTRLAWLIACGSLGWAIGFLGQRWTGDETWYLALPVVVVLGWLRFGRPDRCEACDRLDAPQNKSPRP